MKFYLKLSFFISVLTIFISVLTREQLSLFLKNSDLHRLSQYARNMIDYHLIMDLLPTLAFLYFDERLDAEVHDFSKWQL